MAIAVQPFEGTYELDPNHSSFQFEVTHLNLSTFRARTLCERAKGAVFASVSAQLFWPIAGQPFLLNFQ